MGGELTPSLVRTEGAILTPLNPKIFQKNLQTAKKPPAPAWNRRLVGLYKWWLKILASNDTGWTFHLGGERF